MKKSVIIALLLICSSLAIAAGPQDYPAGLVSYWKADGDATDSAGSNDGTFAAGTYTVDQFGGQAFDFDGITGCVNVGNDSSLNFDSGDSFSIGFWINTTGEDDGTITDWIVGRIGGGTYTYTFYMALDNTLNFGIWDGTSVPLASISLGLINDSQFHHIVGVRDVSTDTLYLYVDGNLEDSTTDTTTGSIAGSSETSIGCEIVSGTPYANSFTNGMVDEVAIWNRSLSSSEVSGLYNSYNESGVIPEVSGALGLRIVAILAAVLLLIAMLRKSN